MPILIFLPVRMFCLQDYIGEPVAGVHDGTNAWMTGETTCKLKIPGAASYTTITSTQTDYHDLDAHHQGLTIQVISVLQILPHWSMPLIQMVLIPLQMWLARLGIINGCGGWTIVIAYCNPSLQPRNLNCV